MREMGNRDLYGVQETNQQIYEDARENKRHGLKKSAYYHRYFEGYSEIIRQEPGKRKKIERIYTAPWKMQAGSDRRRIARRMLYGVFLLCAVVVFLYTGTRDVPCNRVWYGGMAGGVTSMFLFLGLAALIQYCLQKKRMTIYQMKSSSGMLRKTAAACAAGFMILAVIAAVHREPGIVLLYLTGMLLTASVSILESKVRYMDVENHAVVSEEATYIQ